MKRIALAGGTLTVAAGLLGLAGWATGVRTIASLSPRFVPMAHSTALCLPLAGAALLLLVLAPESKVSRSVAMFFSLVVLAVGLSIALETLAGVRPHIDRLISPEPALGTIHVWHMAPISSLEFTLASVALFALAQHGRRRAADVAGLIGTAVAAIGLVVTLGYAYGAPLLYGSGVKPMALLTALGFVSLGAGLIAAAGPDQILLHPYFEGSTRALLLRTFVPLTVAIAMLYGAIDYLIVDRLGVNHAFASALMAIVFWTIVALVVFRVAHRIGGRLDRADAARRRAEQELRQALADLRVERQRMEELAKVTIEAQESERLSLASQIHDSLVQVLVAISFFLQSIADADLDPAARDRVTKVSELATSAVEKGRAILKEIQPLPEPVIDLPGAVRRYAGTIFSGSAVETEFHFSSALPRLSVPESTNILRIAQEALLNACRHAKADTVTVELSTTDDAFELRVSDNGVGFDAKEISGAPAGGFGLLAMRERALMVGGELVVESSLGKGTIVRAAFPLEGVHPPASK